MVVACSTFPSHISLRIFSLKNNVLENITFHSGTSVKKKQKKQHYSSPSSSVDPGTFVFCPEVSPLKRYHDCFPCNRKYSFLCTKTGTQSEQNTTCRPYSHLITCYSINVHLCIRGGVTKIFSYPVRSGGIGRGLLKSSLPTNQYVCSIPFP